MPMRICVAFSSPISPSSLLTVAIDRRVRLHNMHNKTTTACATNRTYFDRLIDVLRRPAHSMKRPMRILVPGGGDATIAAHAPAQLLRGVRDRCMVGSLAHCIATMQFTANPRHQQQQVAIFQGSYATEATRGPGDQRSNAAVPPTVDAAHALPSTRSAADVDVVGHHLRVAFGKVWCTADACCEFFVRRM
jgi:hypothetical protein